MSGSIHIKGKTGSELSCASPSRLVLSAEPALPAFSLRHAATIAEFKATRRTLEAFNEFSRRPGYGRMMSEVRSAVVRNKANAKDLDSSELIDEAAHALGVPRIDLLTLARVPADAVAAGQWRPRSVNVDLVDPDPTTKIGPDTKFQKSLNRISEKIMPGVKEFRVPGMYSAYMFAGEFAPVIDGAGRMIADPLAAAGHVVREWSDSLATEVQLKLRDIREATKPSGLAVGDIGKLSELEQRAFLFAAGKLSGMALDADQFIDWARDPSATDVPKGLFARLKKFASGGLDGLAHFLRGTASAVRHVTDMDAWRTFTVHLQVGGGVERFTVSTRGGFTIMLPTLEQVARDGEAVVRVVSRLNPVETMFGGVSLTSRGGGVKFRAGPVGAKISEFEHEVKAGIPGIIGVSVGEDYAYGPSIAFGYSPPIGILGALPLPLNVRVGGEVTLFHPALAPFAQATRKMAEKISIACDDGAIVLRKLVGKEANEVEDGWPVRQRWNVAKRTTERAEAAAALAGDRLARVRELGALELVKPSRVQKLLGKDAEKPLETFGTITRYLEALPRLIEKEAAAVRAMAERAARGEEFDKAALSRLTESLGRRALAFEYVDVLVSAMLSIVAEEQSPLPQAVNG
jgi:hypothetical protein